MASGALRGNRRRKKRQGSSKTLSGGTSTPAETCLAAATPVGDVQLTPLEDSAFAAPAAVAAASRSSSPIIVEVDPYHMSDVDCDEFISAHERCGGDMDIVHLSFTPRAAPAAVPAPLGSDDAAPAAAKDSTPAAPAASFAAAPLPESGDADDQSSTSRHSAASHGVTDSDPYTPPSATTAATVQARAAACVTQAQQLERINSYVSSELAYTKQDSLFEIEDELSELLQLADSLNVGSP